VNHVARINLGNGHEIRLTYKSGIAPPHWQGAESWQLLVMQACMALKETIIQSYAISESRGNHGRGTLYFGVQNIIPFCRPSKRKNGCMVCRWITELCWIGAGVSRASKGYFKIATEMVKRNVWQERPYLPLYSAFGCSMLLLDMQGHHGTRAIKSEPQHLRTRFHPQSSLCGWGQTLIRTRLKHFADLFPNIHGHIDMVKPLYPVNIT
jgi:hypothetical protein